MAEGMSVKHLLYISPGAVSFALFELSLTLVGFYFVKRVHVSLSPAVGSGGHGPLQPADPAHLGGELLLFPVALSQREPLGVVQNQPWLPQTHPQTEDRVELKVH